jgi:hypothetical protein
VPFGEDVPEAQQQRQVVAALAQVVHERLEVDADPLGAVRAHLDVAPVVDGEVPRRPERELIQIKAVPHRPALKRAFLVQGTIRLPVMAGPHPDFAPSRSPLQSPP